MKSILSLLLIGSAWAYTLNESITATHQTVKALIAEDRIICKAQGLCPVQAESIKGAAVPCSGGSASGYPCSGVDLLSFISLSELGCSNCDGNDVWGWTDPLNGDKYVIAGTTVGTSFVRATDPENPVVVAWIPSRVSTATIWRDIKVYGNRAYIVADRSNQYMQYFDLTRLRGLNTRTTLQPDGVFLYTMGTGNTHNIVINQDTDGARRAYLVGNNGCSGGLYAVNIDVNPPVYAGCFSSDGYTHDAECVTYHGSDSRYIGQEICFGYNENSLTIVNFQSASSPSMISRTSYNGVAYTHQGWLSDDHNFLFLDDELDEVRGTYGNDGRARTYIWDVRNLQSPINRGFFQNPNINLKSIDHNLYTKGNYIYLANYETGLRVYQFATNLITGQATVQEVAYFDTYPESNTASFNGAWSNYPYFEGGNNFVAVQDINRGLFLLKPFNFDQEDAQSKYQYYKDLAFEKYNISRRSA